MDATSLDTSKLATGIYRRQTLLLGSRQKAGQDNITLTARRVVGWNLHIDLPGIGNLTLQLPPHLCPPQAIYQPWDAAQATHHANQLPLMIQVWPVAGEEMQRPHPAAGLDGAGNQDGPSAAVHPFAPASPIDAAASATPSHSPVADSPPAHPHPAPAAPAHESAAHASAPHTEPPSHVESFPQS